jgi:hypothetical protein
VPNACFLISFGFKPPLTHTSIWQCSVPQPWTSTHP